MKRLGLVLVLLSGCADEFDRLGSEARCRNHTAGCADAGAASDAGTDAGADLDAGSLDAGSDAGTDGGDADGGDLDAGAPDAGTIDAGPPARMVDLTWTWLAWEGLDSREARGPGAVVAADAGHVLFFIEGYPTELGTNLPLGYSHGYVVMLDALTGKWVTLDGGTGIRDQYARLQYVGSLRGPINAQGSEVFYPTIERLIDGGRPPQLDGGFLSDGGWVQYATLDSLSSASRSVVNGRYLGETLYPPIAAAELNYSGTRRPAYVGDALLGSTLLFPASGTNPAAQLSLLSTCTGPALDVITTVVPSNNPGVDDERLVTLSRCSATDAGLDLWATAYSTAVPFEAKQLANAALSARMAIASEGVAGRSPFVGWSTAGALRLVRLQASGLTGAINPRRVAEGLGLTVAAMAVDDQNGPIVVIQAASNSPITMSDLPDASFLPTSHLVIASFDESLQLRWAGPLVATQRVVSNSVTWASGQLIIELQCPDSVEATQPIGSPCWSTLSSSVARLSFTDGTQP